MTIKQTVLIVDDEPQNIDVLKGILGDTYRIKAATNGEKALRIALSDNPPDLILLDIMMPSMDGYEVCAKLKADPRTERVPVIFVTAMGEIKDEERGFELGAVDYITKPVSPPLVKARAKSQLALYDQNRVLEQKVLERTAEIRGLNAEIENMMDAMIKMIAGAIDAKSPYTGGHCERVPELANLLCRAASDCQSGPLADFSFKTEEEWREFEVAGWLHDCGKVTTPEHVVDKATKLETIWNRIHEVRMRFEVMLRDAEIERLQSIYEGDSTADEAKAHFENRKAQLIDDFAFLAECNQGGECLQQENIERIRQIGSQSWMRHFDDRLGLSEDESRRYPKDSVKELPVREILLSNRPEHLIPRPASKALDPKFGIKIDVPEYLYNLGELHNLEVSRGTLTPEERFKINEHIIQTIYILEEMPFPAHLSKVPEIAGGHHETLIGTGYPRKLTEKELSIPARIMAIADIFEALTASDRPYKKAKTLSESIRILSFFKKDRHIDPFLFDLFLTSGIYKTYAERFLSAEQIDDVDIQQYLG